MELMVPRGGSVCYKIRKISVLQTSAASRKEILWFVSHHEISFNTTKTLGKIYMSLLY